MPRVEWTHSISSSVCPFSSFDASSVPASFVAAAVASVVIASGQFQARTIANVVVGRGELRDDFIDRLAAHLHRLAQRVAIDGDAVDAAMQVIAVRVAKVVLQVADDRVLPVGDVERAVAADAHRRRAEVRVLREHDRLDRVGVERSAGRC